MLLVNGEPITSLDIQQRSKFIEMSSHKAPTRQEAIDSLIDQILELREAKRYGIEPTDADVNNAYASVASHMGVDTSKAHPDTRQRRRERGHPQAAAEGADCLDAVWCADATRPAWKSPTPTSKRS